MGIGEEAEHDTGRGEEKPSVTMDRQALIDAVIDLEHQYTKTVFELIDVLNQVEAATQKAHALLASNAINTAKQRLFHVALADDNPLLGEAMDDLLEQWFEEHRGKTGD